MDQSIITPNPNSNILAYNNMFDNFVEQSYHSWDKVYTHAETDNSLYIGDAQSAMDLDFLREQSIRTVVTAARDMDHISYKEGIHHVVYPLLDGKQEDIAVFFDNFYEIVQKNLQKGSVLVHCAAGVSRSSTLVISYIMKREKMSFKEAIALVRKSRPSVLPNLGFERQLKRYQEELRANPTRNSRRKEGKINESGRSQFLFRTELMPMLGGNQKLKEKLLSANVRNLMDKISDKDLQVIRTYNRTRNQTKNKKFMISKKSASFTKHYDDLKNALVVGNEPKGSSREVNTGDERRPAKTPLHEMKEIYLSRKNHTHIDKRFPTQRGHTFYNAPNNKLKAYQ